MRKGKEIADCFGKRVRNAFSLVELLVVIGIIALLASLIFPAISMVKENARKTQAKSMASALVMAIKQYETTYGLLPIGTGTLKVKGSAQEVLNDDDAYDLLIELLSRVDGPGSWDGTDGSSSDPGNTRKIRFLAVPSDYNSNVAYRDPWGNRFKVGIDANYDKKVTGFISTPLNGTVFVYSLGPKVNSNDPVTQKDAYGNNKKSSSSDVINGNTAAGDDGGDPVKDVLSWK
jgi:prepilin-type N-terminal cleavage/methylation domain-containing protein